MEGSGQHQANPHKTKPANSQRQDDFLNLEREQDRRNSRTEDSKLIYNCTQSELIYMNAKLLGLRVCSYLSPKFNSNLL